MNPQIDQNKNGSGPERRKHRKPLLIAAVLLLVLTGAAALTLGLSRAGGSAPQTEGAAPAESGLETTLPPEFSPAPEQSAQEEEPAPEGAEEPDDGVQPYVLEADTLSWSGEGKLLYAGGSYYTMTENGPEPVEMQNLTTTIELYGASWDVNFDYAVIDGEVALRSNLYPEYYAIIDGEKVMQSDYYAQHDPMEEGETGESPIWYRSKVATPYQLPGSGDTVMLAILREDQAGTCEYKFFYNIVTGEITDPLANVPELFSHGAVSHVQFNSSLSRAIAYVGASHYICDLTTGEMTDLDALVADCNPQVENPEASISLGVDMYWADDDTLLLWKLETLPRTLVDENTGFAAQESHPWLLSYHVASGTLNYMLRDVAIEQFGSSGSDFNTPHLHSYLYAQKEFQSIDTAAGTCNIFTEGSYEELWGDFSDSTAARTVLRADDGTLYLIDDTQQAWVNLSDCLAQLPENLQLVQLVTDDWLCLLGDGSVRCYRLPSDLPMTPLTAK